MSKPRNALFLVVALMSLAVVACQPSEPVVEAGARVSHPVIQVPAGKTLLPQSARDAVPAASIT